MQQTKRNGLITLCLGLLIMAAVIYFLWNGRADDHADIRGHITNVSPSIDTNTVFILVEGAIEPDTSYDKASVRVEPQSTKIYMMKENKRVKSSAAQLKVGALVEVDFGSHPVAESYPVQVKAKSVTILNPGS